MKLGVVFFDAFALIERAARGAHAKTEIPQRAGKVCNQRTKFSLSFFVSEQEENIQIRVGEKQSPTVSAKCHEGQALWLSVVDSQNFSKNLLGSAIGKVTECAQCVLRASAGFKLVPDALSFVLGQWSENGQGSQRACMVFAGRLAGSSPGRAAVVTSFRARFRRAPRFESGWLPQPVIGIFYRRQSFLSWPSLKLCPQHAAPADPAAPSRA